MKGQWIGTYAGTQSGHIHVNIDELQNNYAGAAFLFPNPNPAEPNRPLPATHATFLMPNKDADQSFSTQVILPINPQTRLSQDPDSLRDAYPGIEFASDAQIRARLSEDNVLSLDWRTNLGVEGHAALTASLASTPSAIRPVTTVTDWNTFKAFATALPHRQYIFRGQTAPWRLRTSYHRTLRADLGRYHREDLPGLHKHLSSRTRHFFQLADPDQLGAFYNLIQHHGYPTPLLDWTYSPFVAAFFAYRHAVPDPTKPDEKVRIYCFNQAAWRGAFQTVLHIDTSQLHYSVMDLVALDNERMVPQQGISTVTNIDDVETYIMWREKEREEEYLQAMDLPVSARAEVMRELSIMGITAGSLFPGLDGACEELKERNFS